MGFEDERVPRVRVLAKDAAERLRLLRVLEQLDVFVDMVLDLDGLFFSHARVR